MAKAIIFVVASAAINGDLLFKAFVPMSGSYWATPVITLTGQGGSLGSNPYSTYMPEIMGCFPAFEQYRKNMGIVVSIVSSGDLGVLTPRALPIKPKPERQTKVILGKHSKPMQPRGRE
jgi:hypothetical protein